MAKPSPIPAAEIQVVQDLLLRTHGMEARRLRKLPGEYDLNIYVEADDSTPFLLKIAPARADRSSLRFQNAMMDHLSESAPDVGIPQVVPGLSGKRIFDIEWEGKTRLMRLLEWLPGKPWASVNPQDEELLESLGEKLGKLSVGLEGFDHPSAHREHEWDIARTHELVEDPHALFEDPEEQELVKYFMDLFQEAVVPASPFLRKGVNYNDANDWNTIVSTEGPTRQVRGFIDFGDAVYSYRVAELAIALAYAIMDKTDPLAAAIPVIKSFSRVSPLYKEELSVLFPLIAARLLLSVNHAAKRGRSRPDNAYLQISREQAWSLLRKLRAIPPIIAHCAFRAACGLPAHPTTQRFTDWARSQGDSFHQVVDLPAKTAFGWIDLSLGSPALGLCRNFEDADRFERHICRLLEDRGWSLAFGGYQEVRPFYTTVPYKVKGLEGPEWRSLHLGMDFWQAAGSPVYAPLEGTIHSALDNRGERNYGPTLILEHRIDEQFRFYTLYGHLDRKSLAGKARGEKVEAGQRLGAIGKRPENGNWPPHLHFQVMLDLPDDSGDFPGVGLFRLREMWEGLCPDPALLQPQLPESPLGPTEMEEVMHLRSRFLGPSLSLSYQQPLYILRGNLQYLYDHRGRRFLDTVNNVAHVGHEHPVVVEAVQRQAAVLNTNTRYLHPLLPRYAERLQDRFPDKLEVVYLVNSGSEANELALRMARTVTGRQDVIALREGYHGNTGACVDVSSYKFDGKGGKGAPDTTLLLNMPDPLRPPDRPFPEEIDKLLADLQTAGRNPAAFISESILSCGGQVVLPEGFLQKVYTNTRNAGGLCIADEVQTGFGRVGTHMWAFEAQGVVPDIVTLGKPIGNGHPLGAVVCTRAVADAFANGMEYFNTFGGNPVSCAAGLAVLEVLESEALQQKAFETGGYLRNRLLELQQAFPIIGQVRGPGLFQGIELVKDPESLAPATAQGAYLINRMRRHGILMSTDGPFENVLKIKPPMIFGMKDVDFLVETLGKVLQEDYLQV